MAKSKTSSKSAATAPVQAQAPATPKEAAPAKPAKEAKPAAVIVILAEPEKPFRPNSARALYWVQCKAMAGKPLADFYSYVTAADTCPKYSPARLRTGREPEPARGWWSFFQRNGLVKLG